MSKAKTPPPHFGRPTDFKQKGGAPSLSPEHPSGRHVGMRFFPRWWRGAIQALGPGSPKNPILWVQALGPASLPAGMLDFYEINMIAFHTHSSENNCYAHIFFMKAFCPSPKKGLYCKQRRKQKSSLKIQYVCQVAIWAEGLGHPLFA